MCSLYKSARRQTVFNHLLIIVVFFQVSCKKFVEVNSPITNTGSVDAYKSDETAASVLTGLLTTMSTGGSFSGGRTGISVYAGLSADELSLFAGSINTTDIRYFRNALSTAEPLNTDFWNSIYPLIYVSNAAIEGLTNTETLTPAVKKQLLGEARFLRAFYYFYLVNLYGDLPIITGTDYTTNAAKPRSSAAAVWQQITDDLKEAKKMLSAEYVDASLQQVTQERVRPTKWAATALLARVYLYTKNWAGAAAEADTILSHSSLYDLAPLNGVFLKNSIEAIWQLPPTATGYNTADAAFFILPESGPDPYSYTVYLNSWILKNFETGDHRKAEWIDSLTAGGTVYYFPYKYKVNVIGSPVTEYTTLLRVAEQYLIRAEARAQQGDYSGSAADLNRIRSRAGLPGYSGALDKTALLASILHERQVELFTELGHRWLDLKRTGVINEVMKLVSPQKGGTWETTDQLYPIPMNDLLRNPNLRQNEGY